MNHKRIVQEYYSQRASDYDKQKMRTWKSKRGLEARIFETIIDFVSQLKNGFILEVGVGSGRIALPLLNELSNIQFVGIDLSLVMLRQAHRKLVPTNCSFHLLSGDAEFLPFRDAVFDTVLCISTLHYLPSPELALQEFSRVLKPGGFFFYGDITLHKLDHTHFLNRFQKFISPAHSLYYTPSAIQHLLESFGFEVLTTEIIQYTKSFQALFEDKAQYFAISLNDFYQQIESASKQERKLFY